MMNHSPVRSFGALMKWRLFLFVLLIAVKGFSQEKFVAGIVFDKDTRARVAAVNIRNLTTGIAVYNSLKGEFKIDAKPGDRLVFSKQEYYLPDTITVQSNAALAVYMAHTAIQLKEVTIHDTILSPDKRLAATKAEYSKIYGSLGYRDFLTSPNNGGPAGLSIDALYNSLSRSGRNAAHLKQQIEDDYKQNVIDYRFSRTLVSKITGLKDQKLTDFMLKYRPGYYTTTTASDYEYITMIRANFKRYLRNPRTSNNLPALGSGK